MTGTFKLVDADGNDAEEGDLGLLLYNDGTVCDDYFNDYAAVAICQAMGYESINNGLRYFRD